MKIRKDVIYRLNEEGKRLDGKAIEKPEFLEISGSNINSVLTTFNNWVSSITPRFEGCVKVDEDDEKFSIEVTFDYHIEKYTIWKDEGWSNVKLEHQLIYSTFGGEGLNTYETKHSEIYYDTADTLERLTELCPFVDWDAGDAYYCCYNHANSNKLITSVRVITRFKLNYVS